MLKSFLHVRSQTADVIFIATECRPDLRYSLCLDGDSLEATGTDVVADKYVSTEQLTYSCVNSKFCNKDSPSGTVECNLEGDWVLPACNQTAVMEDGGLIFSV